MNQWPSADHLSPRCGPGSAFPYLPHPTHPTPCLRGTDQFRRDAAHAPLAVGVSRAVARGALAQQEAVPLFPADRAAWASAAHTREPCLRRRIRRLIATGGRASATGRAVKRRHCPTWSNPRAGAPRRWRWDGFQLRTRRVPRALLARARGHRDPQPGRMDAVAQGHQQRTPQRAIPRGEWLELVQFPRAHRPAQLLVWQVRPAQAQRDSTRGRVAGYYRAGATQDALVPRLHRPPPPQQPISRAHGPSYRAAAGVPPTLDPAGAALLRRMGVRNRQALAGGSADRSAAGPRSIPHPGRAARFADPLACACSQLAAQRRPPALVELERWANWRVPHRAMPQVSAPNATGPDSTMPAPLLARTQGLAPLAAEPALAGRVSLLAQGASDPEALELLAQHRATAAHPRRRGGLPMTTQPNPPEQATPRSPFDHDAADPACRGAGWFSGAAPAGHPDFATRLPCRWTQEQTTRRRRDQHQALRTLAAFAPQPNGWLTLLGPCGSGNTHLAAARAPAARAHHVPTCFVGGPARLAEVMHHLHPTSAIRADRVFATVRSVDLLRRDDLETEPAPPWAHEQRDQRITHRYHHRRPTVFTSNLPLEQRDPACTAMIITLHAARRRPVCPPTERAR